MVSYFNIIKVEELILVDPLIIKVSGYFFSFNKGYFLSKMSHLSDK